MTAPLPNELKPEVREALEYGLKIDVAQLYPHAHVQAKLAILASYIESLHAERAGAAEVIAWMEESTGNTISASDLALVTDAGQADPFSDYTCPVYRARLQASPREWDAETIKDAPEGFYFIFDGRLKDANARLCSKGFVRTVMKPGYNRAFGPLPLPPAKIMGEP